MLRALLLKITKHLVPILGVIAKMKDSKDVASPVVVFICGVPRSGTTIIYQKLTNTLKFGYTDNYTHYVTHQSFVGGNIASALLLRRKPHSCFSSHHGDTSHCGLSAPSEAGKYWRGVREKRDIQKVADDFRTINNWTGKPYLVKNLYTSLMIDDLASSLPNAKFIHVKRNKADNIRSLRKARETEGIADNEDWSVMPSYHEEFRDLSERLNHQYEKINQIVADSTASKACLEVQFEDFIHNEQLHIETILDFCKLDE